jgi:pSer/pThr/pTyr-binding forkhead associated (FHA) protein
MRQAEAGSAQLVLPDGSRRTLGTAAVTIGRLPECDVVLGDANASRRHVEVRPSTDGSGGYVAIDLGSTNGTKVNGVGIHSHRLHHGDEITIGATHLRFEAQ